MAPNVEPFEFYIEAFRELNTCRSSGFGLGPIPFTAIVEYTKVYEVEDFHEFSYFMRLMDSEYMKLERSKEKANNGSSNTGKRSKSRS